MNSRVTICFLAATVVLGICSLTNAGESELRLSVSYDAKLNSGAQANHIRSRAEVSFETPIEIEYQSFRIELTIFKYSTDEFRAQIDVFEKSGSDWVPINPETISFVGNYTAPVTYDWTYTDIDLDMSLVVFVGFL